MVYTKEDRQEFKKIQARFFSSSPLAYMGHFLTKEDVDELREEVLRPSRCNCVENNDYITELELKINELIKKIT